MKKLADYKDQIEKCSKCGKCQEVCPIYHATGNDCAVSRGKFTMLKGVLNGELKLNKTIIKYIDMCLKCEKCKSYCPSGIDVCEIFSTAKSEYVKNTLYGKITRFLQSREVFNRILNILYIRKTPKDLKNKENKTKLLYFSGCANKIFPNTEKSMKKVLSKYDVELIEKDFDCCGIPFISSGNMERFNEAKNKNKELLAGDYTYIITDCASCESTIKSYAQNGDIEHNIVNVCHFLAIQDKKFIFKKPVKVTFHKPCHLKTDNFLRPILDRCENVEYVEARDYDQCCGFSGEFCVHNPKISKDLATQKARNLLATGADIILTACPACVIGINEGFLLNGNLIHPKVMNLVEFLAMAEIE